jgi:tRNA (mo5U34)-methyltransferase
MDDVREAKPAIDAIHWYHSLQLPGGIVTAGLRSTEHLREDADLIFKYPVAGKSVLDVGAWDGFFSFEAERLGATDVLATDSFCWSGAGWGTKDGFDYAHRALDSRTRSHEVDPLDLDPSQLGQFELVLFLNVLYHLKNPYAGLERVAAMTTDRLVVQTVTKDNDDPRPLLQHLPGFRGDPTNFWVPNIGCLKSMMAALGFSRFEVEPAPFEGRDMPRHIVHFWRG